MEKVEVIKNEIKFQEKLFLQKFEDLIQNEYKLKLMKKYQISIKNIKKCYSDPKNSFFEAESCAKELSDKYFESEFHYKRIIRKFEDGVSRCTNYCTKDFQPVNLIFFPYIH